MISLEFDFDTLGQISASFSGAEIAESINKASLIAARQNQDSVEMNNFIKACDEVFWGMEDYSTKPNLKELENTAYHEAGHALIAIKNNLEVQRITIRPNSRTLGAVQWTRPEGVYSMDITAIKNTIQLALGGIAAEKVKYGNYANGGMSDLQMAKNLVHSAILHSGLGEAGGMAMSAPALWSNELKFSLEKEEQEIMRQCFKNTCDWLESNKELLELLAKELLEKRELGSIDIKLWKQKVYAITDCDYNKLATMEEISYKESNK